MAKKHLQWITDDDLILLDGKTNDPKLQTKIEELKCEREFGKDHAFIVKVINEGKTKGIIKFKCERAVSCEICDKRSHVETYSSGRQRGQYKHTKCKLVPGVSFADDFVVMTGSPRLGICFDCWSRIQDKLKKEIRKERFEYLSLMGDCPYRKDKKRVCCDCGKEMFESEMGREPAILSGSFPSRCPHCGKTSTLFQLHKITDDFRIIDVVGQAQQ